MCKFLALPSLFRSLSQESRASCLFSIGCPLFAQKHQGVPPVIPNLALSRQLTRRHLPFLPLFLAPRAFSEGCRPRQLLSPLFNRFRTLCKNTGGVPQRAIRKHRPHWPLATGHRPLVPLGHCIRRRTVEQSVLLLIWQVVL